MEDSICPRCGATMSRKSVGHHYYYYCVRFEGVGCNSIYADDRNCFFSDIYIITPQGELRDYKSWRGGEFIKTKKFIDGERGKVTDYSYS